MKKLLYSSILVLSLCLPGCLNTSPSSGSVGVNPDTVTVAAGTSQAFTAVLSGSLASSSVKWSVSGAGCSSGSCGTIDQSGNYTAPKTVPASPLIQVIATVTSDPSKLGIANVTIGPSVAIAITQPPANPVPNVAATQSLSSIAAKVSNSSNTTVNWTVVSTSNPPGCTGAACGTLSPASTPDANTTTTYTAPAPLPNPPSVSIVATSAADSTQTASLTVNLSLYVPVSPGSQTVGLLDTQQFQPNVMGQENVPPAASPVTVAWSLTSAGSNCAAVTNPCGTITPGGLYQAPASLPPSTTVMVTASASQNVNATTTLTGTGTATINLTSSTTGSDSQLFDHYAFIYRGYKITGNPGPVTPFVEAGSLIFDGNGKIVAGSVEDDNNGGTFHSQQAVTGTYQFDATDNTRGSITLSAGLVTTLRFVLVPNSSSTVPTTVFLTDFGGATAGTGRMELQDKTKFANATLTGPYAMELRGATVPSAIGRFDAQNTGTTVANGELGRTFSDANFGDCGATSTTITIPAFSNFFTGTISSVNSSGNATFSLQNVSIKGVAAPTPPTFSAYIVSATKIFLVETDTNAYAFVGSAVQQTSTSFSNASFSGIYDQLLDSVNGPGAGNADLTALESPGTNAVGTISGLDGEWGGDLDGAVAISGLDYNNSGYYSVQANGLALITGCPGLFIPRYVAYFISPSRAFLWNIDSNSTTQNYIGDTIGEMDLQQVQPPSLPPSNFGGSTVSYAVSLEGLEGNFASPDTHTASDAIAASGVVQFDYAGAGTVKFILDVSRGAQNTGTTPVTITASYSTSCNSLSPLIDQGCETDDTSFAWGGITGATFSGAPPFTFKIPSHFWVVSGNQIFFSYTDNSGGTYPSNISGVAIKNQ